MSKPFDELRERLLRNGIAPRHVQRYLRELHDHHEDLTAEEQRSGRTRTEAEAAALGRLGSLDQLTRAMTDQPQLRAWSARAPWLAFGIAPLLALAAAYSIALFLLWSGWHLFLADHSTPFVPVRGAAIPYFGLGRLLYFTGPLLVGWTVAVLAARQRLRAAWPSIALVLLAVFGALAQVRAVQTVSSTGARAFHVGMRLAFTNEPGFSGHTLAYNVVTHTAIHAFALLALTLLPYAAWKQRQHNLRGHP